MSGPNATVAASGGDRAYCEAALPRVSRTFAACIGLLPGELRWQVLLAYLLCRIADTVEDTATLPAAEKSRLLGVFGRAVGGDGDGAELAHVFARPEDADQELTRDCAVVLREFRQLGSAQREAIRPWVQEMCDGMAAFALAHAEAAPGRLESLDDVADLDRYCYYVAGTVGHLLTALFALHHRRLTAGHRRRLQELATSFGLGLQLTNIIKDVADDRQRGWSFVPRRLCVAAGIPPEELLDPARRDRAERVMGQLIAKARGHLDDALRYCVALPRSAYRIRLFCLTPLYFAVRTLRLAANDPRLLDPGHKVKITRAEVYRTLRMTALVAPSDTTVRWYYRRLAGGEDAWRIARRGSTAG